jgi:hypothetical protein
LMSIVNPPTLVFEQSPVMVGVYNKVQDINYTKY